MLLIFVWFYYDLWLFNVNFGWLL